MAIIAALMVILIASHGPLVGEARSLPANYTYWTMRLVIEGLLFFVTRSALISYFDKRLSFTATTFTAIAASHLPFVLSVTAIDIALGYPELGIGTASDLDQPRLSALLLEMVYLADNHVAFCLLLSVPRWISATMTSPTSEADASAPATLLATLDPPLAGEVIWVEAQEHYVRITTTQENRLILARFSDILRELSTTKGMQVHRSHWVSEKAVISRQKSGQSLNLVLTTGDKVPVSRSFRKQIDHGALTQATS